MIRGTGDREQRQSQQEFLKGLHDVRNHGGDGAKICCPSRMKSAARSAIMIVGALILPRLAFWRAPVFGVAKARTRFVN